MPFDVCLFNQAWAKLWNSSTTPSAPGQAPGGAPWDRPLFGVFHRVLTVIMSSCGNDMRVYGAEARRELHPDHYFPERRGESS